MPHHDLKIIQRHTPRATHGWVVETIGLAATDAETAAAEATPHLTNLNWETQFAVLQSEDDKFMRFWTARDA